METEDVRPAENDSATESASPSSASPAAEMMFIVIVGIIVLLAFIRSLSYAWVSARTPIVIMVPLLILISVQIVRLRRIIHRGAVSGYVRAVLKGSDSRYRKISEIIFWMILLVFAIFIVGQYLGMALFMFILLRLVSRESWAKSLSISILVTVSIYLLFGFVFEIHLYDGMIYRLWKGYQIF